MVKEYGYEYDAVLDKAIYNNTKGKVVYKKIMGALCMRSGRDALKAVAREFVQTEVLIPALSCDSMALPFEIYGHKVKYYRLRKDYSIDLDNVYSLITKTTEPTLFLYMDYLGNKAIDDVELEQMRINYPEMVFIEDRTHNFLIKSRRSFKPDFIIASLRKWLDIPDGGLLWTYRELKNTKYSEDLTFFESRLQAQCMRHTFLQCGDEEIKKKYRKIFSTITDLIDREKLPGLMSQYSYEKVCKTNFEKIVAIRRRNAQILIDELENFKLVQSESGNGDVYVAVLINNRDVIQRRLASMGIFCTVIWPLNDKQRESCSVAKYTEEHILTIYCDQRYSVEDMIYVASSIRGIYNE